MKSKMEFPRQIQREAREPSLTLFSEESERSCLSATLQVTVSQDRPCTGSRNEQSMHIYNSYHIYYGETKHLCQASASTTPLQHRPAPGTGQPLLGHSEGLPPSTGCPPLLGLCTQVPLAFPTPRPSFIAEPYFHNLTGLDTKPSACNTKEGFFYLKTF